MLVVLTGTELAVVVPLLAVVLVVGALVVDGGTPPLVEGEAGTVVVVWSGINVVGA